MSRPLPKHQIRLVNRATGLPVTPSRPPDSPASPASPASPSADSLPRPSIRSDSSVSSRSTARYAREPEHQSSPRREVPPLQMRTRSSTSAVPVYVVADNSMSDNQFDAYDAPGLGASIDATNTAKIVFVPTRGCNAAFYEFLNKEVVINNVKETVRLFDLGLLQSDRSSNNYIEKVTILKRFFNFMFLC